MAHKRTRTALAPNKRPSYRRRSGAAAMASCWLLVSGCTTVDPVFVSEQLVVTDYANAAGKADAQQYYGELPIVMDAVNRMRYDMLTAVRAETAAKNLIGLTVVVLSALASYKLLTSNGAINEKWLAAVGLGGAAAYFYGTNYITKPRALVYIAGADALNCTVLASSALLLTKEEVSGYDGKGGLKADIANLDTKTREVRAVVQRSLSAVKDLGETGTKKATPQPPKTVCESPAPDLGSIGTRNTTFARPQPKCRTVNTETAADLSTVIFDLVQRQTKALNEYELQISAAETVHADGQRLLASIAQAAHQLRSKAEDIRNRVNVEVLNTQPNLDAILQTAGSLRNIGFQMSGWSKFQPSAPQPVAQSDFDAARAKVKTDLQKIIDKIEQEGDKARRAIEALPQAVTPVRQQLLRAQAASEQTGKLAQCKFTAPANQLSLEPDEESIVVAGASSLVFRVKGGTGSPVATLLGNATGKAKTTVVAAGPAHLVTVDLSAAPSRADRLILHVADGSGTLERTVSIVGAGQGESGGPTLAADGTPPADTSEKTALDSKTAAKMCSKLGLEANCFNQFPEPPRLADCREALGQQGPLKEQDAQAIIDTPRTECKPI